MALSRVPNPCPVDDTPKRAKGHPIRKKPVGTRLHGTLSGSIFAPSRIPLRHPRGCHFGTHMQICTLLRGIPRFHFGTHTIHGTQSYANVHGWETKWPR
jgi:hypothetical protein